jgi:two-component system sensor histidine kinase UhpB
MEQTLTILHLEDSPNDAELVRSLLKSEGIACKITCIETRESFLSALRQIRYDLILSDYSLPAYDGLTALKDAKEICPDVPFIIVSGKLGEDTAIDSMRAGSSDYVQKQKMSRLGPAVRRIISEMDERLKRRQAENSLQESEERYHSLVEHLRIGVALINPQMQVLAVNRQMRIWFPNIDISEKPVCYSCLNTPPRDSICPYCPTFKTLRDGQVHETVIEKISSEGLPVHFRILASPVKESSGKVIASIELVEDITERVLSEQQLKTSREQLRNLAAHLEEARESERKALAREMHDELGQILSALKIDVFMLDMDVERSCVPLAEKKKPMLELIERAISTVQEISSKLRPGLIEHLGLTAAIEWEVKEFEKRSGIQCELSLPDEDMKIDENRDIALYRISQEALTNILRHSGATRVQMELRRESDSLFLTIRDNGKGISKTQIEDPNSFGLTGMRERVIQWDGQLNIEGSNGKGTTITAMIMMRN